jgi:hypothetical protein
VLLALAATAGVLAVRELAEPASQQPVGPIQLDPGARTGEAVGGDEDAGRERRAAGDEDAGGFETPPAGEPDTAAGVAPETPPPQIEVQTPQAPGGSDDEEDGD